MSLIDIVILAVIAVAFVAVCIRIKRKSGIGDYRGHIVGASGLQRHRNQLLGALPLVAYARKHFANSVIFKYTT